MASRGPDGSGVAEFGNERWHATLGHRRLAVVAPGPDGAQPMASPCGRWVISYNGELYNDNDLRRALTGRWDFRTGTDTETVLAAVATWGAAAGARLRGMYAIAVLDTQSGLLTVGRDVMGIKPLFVSQRDRAVAFGSTPGPLAAWFSGGTPRPDMISVAAYLSTIRTTLDARTMFAGVRTLRPGEWMECFAGGPLRTVARHTPEAVENEPAGVVRSVVEESIRRHLRSDVPLCCLLSGGLDSTIVAAVARRELGALHTYCAGADEDGLSGEDFAYARRVAAFLGTSHTEVGVTRQMFAQRLPEMIAALGVPLSTPNEVAIAEVARAMRADGKVVTLSGEGADELFGGYDKVLASALAHDSEGSDPAEFWCGSHAWVPVDGLGHVLTPEAWAACEGGARTRTAIEHEFESIGRERGDTGHLAIERHLRYQRRVNLEGLLRRLDTATMLASVEGRTPFADSAVCAAAEQLPTSRKIRFQGEGTDTKIGEPGWSKIALREAFADIVPVEILARSKASFPLPFERWISDQSPRLREATWLREIVRPDVIEAVASDASAHWRLAWPLVNLAIWGESFAAVPQAVGVGFIEASDASASPATRKTVHSSIGTAPSFL